MITPIDEVTEVMREADRRFESTGGSTRHYVRDLLIPMLEDAGMIIIKIGTVRKLTVDASEIKKEMTLKLRAKGYSIRQIQTALGYKSPRSVHKIIKDAS